MTEQIQQKTEIASLPARFIAALVDYLVINAFLLLTSKLSHFNDFSFLLTFLIGLVYYSFGNSRFFLGQTLGKRLFGLRVVSTNSPHKYLGIQNSLMRYLYSFGLIILIVETPLIIYRSLSVVASPVLLDAHMLIVLAYTMINLAVLIAHAWHRAAHDYLAKSLVVRDKEQNGVIHLDSLGSAKHLVPLRHAIASALILAGFLWGSGVSHSPEITSIQSERFLIEHNFPFRLSSVYQERQTIKISGVYTEAVNITSAKENEPPAAIRETLQKIAKVLNQASIKNLNLEFDITALSSSMELKNYKVSINQVDESALSNTDQQ